MNNFKWKHVTNKLLNCYQNHHTFDYYATCQQYTCMLTFFSSKISEEDSDDLEEEVNHEPGYYEEQEEIKKRQDITTYC